MTDNCLATNRLILQELNWNKNPAIREAAEQLGIFEAEPIAGPIHLEKNPALKKMAEEIGFTEKSIPKPRPKAKSTNFSELLRELNKSNASESDLGIIDAEVVEVVKKPLQIRIQEE
jgi:hypothetical protein